MFFHALLEGNEGSFSHCFLLVRNLQVTLRVFSAKFHFTIIETLKHIFEGHPLKEWTLINV